MHVLTWLREWLQRWRELVFWLPWALAGVLGLFYLLPAMDPRASVDGLGALWGMALNVVGAIVAGFLAWLFCDTYHWQPRDKDERELVDRAMGCDRTPNGNAFGFGVVSWPAAVIYIWNQVLWLIVFALLLPLFSS